MNQHCFLLDGKTILPINHTNQLFLPLKIRNENKYRLSHDKKIHERGEDFRSFSFQSDDAERKINCKYNQQMNNIETYLITRILPTDSISVKDKPSTITVVIASSENRLKRKNSSSSPQQQRLSTFKDITRIVPSATPVDENKSSNILNSGRLLNIYRNKKEKLN